MIRLSHTKTKRPIGGYVCTLDGMKFVGGSVDGLIDEVYRYRAHAALPPGDPESEILDCFRDRAKWLVEERDLTPAEIEETEQTRVAATTMRAWRNYVTLFQPADHKVVSRQEICAKCPFARTVSDRQNAYTVEANHRLARLLGATDTLQRGWCCAHHIAISLVTRLADTTSCGLQPGTDGCWITP